MPAQKLFSRSLQEIGPNSRGVTIPKQILDYHGCEAGDEIMIEDMDLQEGKITYSLNGL